MSEPKDCNIIEMGYTIQDPTTKERIFKRNVYINFNQYFEFIKNTNYLDTYYSAYLYDSKEIDNANLYGSLYLDFDDVNDLDKARQDVIRTLSFFKIVYKIPNNQIKIYFSGHKGFHMIVPKEVLGIKPDKNLNSIFRTIAEQVNTFSTNKTIDLKIYDNKRLFRVPNSLHSETNLYKILLLPDELYTLSIEDIMNLAKNPRKIDLKTNMLTVNPVANHQYLDAIKTWQRTNAEIEKKKKGFRYKKTLTVTPPCIQNILENGAEEGSRNVSIACLTSFYKESGKTFDEIVDLIGQWNSRNTKPTPEREMKTTIKSIFFGLKTYGCTTLQTLTQCDKTKCELIKPKKTKQRRNVPHAIRIN